MPTAIILGLPKGLADRVKGELKNQAQSWRSGWNVHFVPPTGAHSQLREADIRTAQNNAMREPGSAHIFAITNQGGGRKQDVAINFTPYFRFRWLPGKWLALPYPSPAEFIVKINETLAEEDEWKELVQPQDVSSCLLLPASAFSTRLSDLWELAMGYGEGTTVGCKRRKTEFERQHHKSHASEKHPKDYFWTDDSQRIFDHTGPQHGEAPELRQWKYSYRIPPGFHYDVRHASGQKFSVSGSLKTESVKQGHYVNLDVHGYFRQ